MRAALLVAAATGLVASLGGAAHAGTKWPTPAGGPSASGDPEILFTFDDGPHEKFTPPILDALEKHGIQAVFFWVGWRVSGDGRNAERRRQLVTRAVAEGHLIANHTVSHAHMCAVPAKKAEWEIDEAARILAGLAGMPVRWFRTPYGSRCKRLEVILADRGLSHLGWDFDPMEYLGKSSDETREYLKRKISRLKGRAIILVHDTHTQGAKAIPEVLDWLAQENARRVARGKKPIRVLSYADLALEQIDPAVRELVDGMLAGALDFGPSLMSSMVAPLAAPPVHARL